MKLTENQKLKSRKKKPRKQIESLLKNLKKASKLVDHVAEQSQFLDDLDRSNFIHRVGASLRYIFELQSDLFDLEPELTYKYLKPSLSPVDLSAALERLLSQNREICESAIAEFKSYMTEDVAFQFAQAWDSGYGYEFAENWWRNCKKPFVPVVRVYKDLRHERRYARYWSAKLLEKEFGATIWDEDRADVSLEIADRWFKSWLIEQKD
jgi:hypothetical protein